MWKFLRPIGRKQPWYVHLVFHIVSSWQVDPDNNAIVTYIESTQGKMRISLR